MDPKSVLILLGALVALTLAENATVATPDPYLGCGNYTEHNGMCYSIKTNTENFTSAHGTCVEQGGHLLSIHDLETNQFYYNLLVQSGIQRNFWIGLQYSAPNYNWTDSTESTLRNMAKSNSLPAGTNCFALSNVRLKEPSQWVREDCTTALPFICQRKKTKMPTTTTTTTTTVTTTPQRKPGCGQIQFTAEGQIASPNYPDPFQSASCTYQIDLSNVTTVHAHSVNVKIPVIKAMGSWVLSVYDGTVVDPAFLITTITSGDPPVERTFSSLEPQMLIQFASAASVVGQPFFISFSGSLEPKYPTGKLTASKMPATGCGDKCT